MDRNTRIIRFPRICHRSPSARGAWIATAGRGGARHGEKSPSARGAWIATRSGGADRVGERSPSARGAWIATPMLQEGLGHRRMSPSARGAWIATGLFRREHRAYEVALREGGVDRNLTDATTAAARGVALREGGVDRNTEDGAENQNQVRRPPRGGRGSQPRARQRTRRPPRRPPRGGRGSQLQGYRAPGVPGGRPPRGGRGSQLRGWRTGCARASSPSARGAWIATSLRSSVCPLFRVALREGGVDRNMGPRAVRVRRGRRPPRGGRGSQHEKLDRPLDPQSRPPRGGRGSQHVRRHRPAGRGLSPSARGAWIATVRYLRKLMLRIVALREGGVDRNLSKRVVGQRDMRRPPRGGRGSQPGGRQRVRLAGMGRPPRGGRGSQPSRHIRRSAAHRVALREGGVDRNTSWVSSATSSRVALREGGVDRNTSGTIVTPATKGRPPRGGRGSQRAQLADQLARRRRPPRGGRGSQHEFAGDVAARPRRPPRGGRGSQQSRGRAPRSAAASPSARGAWIATTSGRWARTSSSRRPPRGGRGSQHHVEGRCGLRRSRPPRGGRGSQQFRRAEPHGNVWVALREGGVDRNHHRRRERQAEASPSARGAWIATFRALALGCWPGCRPPRGGRGSQPSWSPRVRS